MFSDATAWHANQLAKAAGQCVTYVAGRHRIKIEDAIPGRTDQEGSGSEGRVITMWQYDWLIRRELLVVNGVALTPRPGHQIWKGKDVFEVQDLGDGQCYSDVTDDLMRIHTRLIKTKD